LAHGKIKTNPRKPEPPYAKSAASAQLFPENPISYILKLLQGVLLKKALSLMTTHKFLLPVVSPVKLF